MMKKTCTILLLFFLSITVSAQLHRLPVKISVFNEATAIPFTRFFTTPVHPGIEAGTEVNYKIKKHHRWFQEVGISWYYHKNLNHAFTLSTALGYEYRSQPGVSLSASLGAGYLRSYNVTNKYVLQNGAYEKKSDRGRGSIAPSFSLIAGYYLNKKPSAPQLFVKYQSWAEYPFSPGFIPVVTHINLHAGAKIFIK